MHLYKKYKTIYFKSVESRYYSISSAILYTIRGKNRQEENKKEKTEEKGTKEKKNKELIMKRRQKMPQSSLEKVKRRRHQGEKTK